MESPLCLRNTTITALKYVVFHVTPSSPLILIKAAGFKWKQHYWDTKWSADVLKKRMSESKMERENIYIKTSQTEQRILGWMWHKKISEKVKTLTALQNRKLNYQSFRLVAPVNGKKANVQEELSTKQWCWLGLDLSGEGTAALDVPHDRLNHFWSSALTPNVNCV